MGQGEEALKKGPGLGLGTWCHARDGALPQQGAHGVGVDTEPEDPCLGSLVIGGRCGIQSHRKSLPGLQGQWFKSAPATMSLEGLGNLEVVLGFSKNPPVCPEGFFEWVLEPLCPFDGQWCMPLVVVPSAQPNDVAGTPHNGQVLVSSPWR